MSETVHQILKKFIDGLNKSSGAAAALVHEHQDPRFMPIYEKLTSVRNKAIDMAMKATNMGVQHGTKH